MRPSTGDKGCLTWADAVSDCVSSFVEDQGVNWDELAGIIEKTKNLVAAPSRHTSVLCKTLLPPVQRLLPKVQHDQEKAQLCDDFISHLSTVQNRSLPQRPNIALIENGQLAPGIDDGRPAKRARLHRDVDEQMHTHGHLDLKALWGVLRAPEETGLDELPDLLPGLMAQLSETERCHVMKMISDYSCSFALPKNNDSVNRICTACEVPKPPKFIMDPCHSDELNMMFESLLKIYPLFQRSPKCRVAALLSIRKILMHSANTRYLKLSESPIGELCLQSMKSSLRELRIAAANALTAFLIRRNGVPLEIVRENRILLLDFLASMYAKNDVPQQETCIFSLEQIALVSGEEELNIVLVRLVEYLGHPNQYVSGFVYAQLLKLAQSMEMPPAAMFRPYWRTVSVVIMRNLQSRPIIAENVCRLLGMNLEGLLMMTEEYTLPYLVLTRKSDIIRRIANAHGEDMTTYKLCTQERNLAAILAYLISQPSSDTEQLATRLLAEVSPEFRERELSVWIKLEPLLIACELLKNIVDAGEGRAAKAHQAMHLLATLHSKKGHGSGSRRGDAVGVFLEQHVLGITTNFASTLNDGQVIHPLIEKRRCLAAMGELMKLGKSRVNTALPQICAYLRSALEFVDLSDQAFVSWAEMIESLDAIDIEPLVDQTVAVIVQHWENFQTATQERAYGLMSFILKNHSELVREIFQSIPSLASIQVMAKFESEIRALKKQMDIKHQLQAFGERSRSETAAVAEQALNELASFLEAHQEYLHRSILSHQSDSTITALTRAVLDCSVKFNSVPAIATDAARCLGLIGCLDPNRHESVREKTEIVVLSSFVRADETSEFVLAFLQNVLVNAFLSASNTRAQGLLAWAMQELLMICNFSEAVVLRTFELSDKYHRWMALPDGARNTLTPFLTSKYTIAASNIDMKCVYPLFAPERLTHGQWLRALVLDMLQVCPNDNTNLIYSVFARVVRGQGLAISTFLLPFVAQSLVIGGTESQKTQLVSEMLLVLNYPLTGAHQTQEVIRACSESVFEIIEYLSAWAHKKKKQIQSHSASNRVDLRSDIEPPEDARQQIDVVESVLQRIPPEVISRRAVECRTFSRALFHWEQYIRRIDAEGQSQEERDEMLIRLQEIYTEIDEPDGIEGISAQLFAPNLEQQILEHRKAGRWTAAQRWYELQLDEHPHDCDVQVNLLTCLKESGQFDVLLNQYDSLRTVESTASLLPFAVEATWNTGKWQKLGDYLKSRNNKAGDFNIEIGSALLCLHRHDKESFEMKVKDLRRSLGESLNASNTSSLQSCHETLFKLHVLTEIETIANVQHGDREQLFPTLDRRLDILGAYVSDKQYLLGIRRAVMELTEGFLPLDRASAWLTSAKLARKSGSLDQALNAVLHATHAGDSSASIEHARLLWKEGRHRRAIQVLEGALDSGAFRSHNRTAAEDDRVTLTADQQEEQNKITARAHLLLAKWLDLGGQTQSDVIIRSYRKATDFHRRWDKGHYYLGKHYNKLIDSEKTKPIGKEATTYLTGELAKIVIDNYLRAAMVGSKYVFQTLPKILTLWLELVDGVDQPHDSRRGNERFNAHTIASRKKVVDDVNSQLKKYIDRIPAYLLYTILPQVVARIVHPNTAVYNNMVALIVRVVRAYPQQAMWTVLAVVKSSNKERAGRGLSILGKIVETQKKSSREASSTDLRALVTHGQKLSDELLRVSDYHIEGKTSRVSLAKDLGFNHKIAPSRLVVPIEASLIPNLPSNLDAAALKTFKAFSKDAITISSFLDEALVLSSLQKPRKLSIRGSDGRVYGLLAKPKDDLRKDQRLMEFNTMINRFLKRDVDASTRRLYIRTYAVVPLNEECGLIEWVDNLKTFRDILLKIYKEKGTAINYMEIRTLLDEACSGDPTKLDIFDKRVLKMFPPVFHEWFVETFMDPSAWFAARLRYTRSAAVMSMVGHVLGLGDRHGENILFEEDNGGTLHVDFNCLFDKGLTFEKPEMVPFRLTHNMIDAMGPYRYDGPFRRCCEITLQLLRANEEALMTILETFLHDPTTDFIGGKKKRNHQLVPDTPLGVLEGVRGKDPGFMFARLQGSKDIMYQRVMEHGQH
ncbi:putative phosphatidylinositol 3and 4-kinase [Phaeomoniella chlamydospora]|uniref:non-specific serine/threonine protein kinase n=1 Tax=Phaeomoniella chlamydospora TaxID=158046 RepID=A0A0G2E6P4_PHACM|nr:putative phosphatidylinositol 3and 4-kinase [Phaeomoniella chlamydospora]